ncbi:MAG: glycosyltransferase family 2 protein [Acidimicrobiales bacterium]
MDADRLRAVGGFDPLHVFYPGDPDLFYSGDADLARRLSRSFPDTVVRVFLRGPLVESLAWTGADRAVMREAKLASLHRFSRDAEGAGWVAVRGVLATICAGRRCRSRVAAGDDVITPIILPPSASSPRRVSVVIPCHNYGRYLPEALTSVFCQSRPADELVVVDDGSSDDTPSVLEHLMAEHPRTTVIRRTPARGAVATFNDGVRASSGDLVVILSADDRMSDDYLEELERALDQSKADFAYSGLRGFGAGEWWTPAKPFDRRVLARGNFVNGSAMFRRDLFDRIGGFDPAFAGLRKEDWAFWLRAVNLGASGAPAAHCWLEYRQHGGIGSSRNRVGLGVVIRTHLRARRANPDVIRPVDLVVGVGHETSEAVRRWWWRGLAELAGAR